MKITLEIPLLDAVRLKDLVDLIRNESPSTDALVAELKKHGVDLSKIEIS